MRKTFRQDIKELGTLRTSQLITTFGVGAIVDFREETAILGGADDWYNFPVEEDRILRCHSLEMILKRAFFVRPKCDQRNQSIYKKSLSHDIGAYRFPKTQYCPTCTRLWMDDQLAGLQKGALCCPKCAKRLVPSRFVVICRHGHIDDFPYASWVHHGSKCEKKADGRPDNLKLFYMNARTNLGSLMVACEDCGKVRSIRDAFVPETFASMHKCTGRQPWLDHDDSFPCMERPVVRMRASTGVYMAVNISALSIPPWSADISKILLKHLDAMEGKNEEALISYIQRKIHPFLPKATMAQILEAYQSLTSVQTLNHPSSTKELYEEEYRALCKETEDENADFRSRQLTPPEKYHDLISRIIAVDRLTEIVAMIGFTRLYGWDGDLNSPCLAPIFSHDHGQWLPAIDMHGEGIFIQLNEKRVAKWEKRNQHIYQPMIKRAVDNHIHCENVSARYVLLHTLAHLFIRSLAKRCGYQTSSLKERIYSTYENGDEMAGILIYTASSDAEGSLGGLVTQATPEHMEENIDSLLAEAEWCSGDPLCMSSTDMNGQGLYGLNYGACHQCALLPETSCAMRNLFLDRAALIGRTEDGTVGYFSEIVTS